MADSLLQRIYGIGEEMVSSLRNGTYDRYFDLVAKRGTLLEKLTQYEHPSELDANWRGIAELLQKQHEALVIVHQEEERKMQDVLEGIQRFKGATRSYQRPDERSQILNDNLRV